MDENKKIISSTQEEKEPEPLWVSLPDENGNMTGGFKMLLRSNTARRAHYELTKYLESVRDGKEGCEVNVFWVQSMLNALPAALELMSNAQLLSHFIVAPATLDVMGRLVNHEPLTPLNSIEDAPDEWNDVSVMFDGQPRWQNQRFPSLFYDGETKRYNNTNQTYFNKQPLDLTFTTRYFDEEMSRVFGPWLEKQKDAEASAYRYCYNTLVGSACNPITMPYLPPKRVCYDVDWVAEMVATGMNQVYRQIKEPAASGAEFDGAVKPIIVCNTICWGIYPMEYKRHRSVFIWADFSGHLAGAKDHVKEEYAILELGEDFSNFTLKELDMYLSYLEETVGAYMDTVVKTIHGFGKGCALYLPKVDNDGERWFITSDMIDSSVSEHDTIIETCQLVCETVIGSASTRASRAPAFEATFNPNSALFSYCPPLLDMAKKKAERIDRVTRDGSYNQVWFSRENKEETPKE